jgi:TPR repeat protein/serine/threonine protein kinase
MIAAILPDSLGAPGCCARCGTSLLGLPLAEGPLPLSEAVPVVVTAPRTIMGRYQIGEKLGRGAFGTVYRGHDSQLDREVALKVLHPEALVSPHAVERFQREARTAAKMRHPHIVPVYDAGKDGDHFFTASALIPGSTLAAVIRQGGLEPRRAARLTIQLAEALAYAHKQGVLHRDVKPGNIMLDNEDNLYLMDFGLAWWTEQAGTRLTKDGAVLGTPGYMAPEQAAGDLQQLGPAIDLYSAGMVLYEMLTGRLPFEGPVLVVLYHVIHTPPPPPSKHRPGLDLWLEAICLKAIARKPEDRFGSGQEMAEVLQAWLSSQAHLPPLAEPVPAPLPTFQAPLALPVAPAAVQETVAPPSVAEPLPPPPAAAPMPEWVSDFLGGEAVPPAIPAPPQRSEAPEPEAITPRRFRFPPRWQPWMLPVGLILAGVGGLAVLVMAIRSQWHSEEPLPSSEGPPTRMGTVSPLVEPLDRRLLEGVRADIEQYSKLWRMGKDPSSFIKQTAPRRLGDWRTAAERDCPEGQLLWSFCLEFGAEMAINDREAARWCQLAAEKGYALAQIILGDRYSLGLSIDQSDLKAAQWYGKAAKQGDPRAQTRLGDCCLHGNKPSREETENARGWYVKAAEQGDAEGQRKLGNLYADPKYSLKNDEEAVKWYRKAAEQGDAEAQCQLGTFYAEGRGGLEENEEEAVRWYRKSAEQGNDGGQYHLGACYEQGNGVKKDVEEAIKWYRKASGKNLRAEARLKALTGGRK